jgi:hypothetical protein
MASAREICGPVNAVMSGIVFLKPSPAFYVMISSAAPAGRQQSTNLSAALLRVKLDRSVQAALKMAMSGRAW